MTGTVTAVRVTITNYFHWLPHEVDVALVGPTGAATWLFSDIPGSNVPYTVTFSQSAPTSLTSWTNGTFQPTNRLGNADILTGPATVPTVTDLNVFNGLDPNGTWRLYVQDNTGGDDGSIGSWSLTIETGVPNMPPVNSVPLAVQATNDATPLVFSTGNGNAISISDPDAASNPVQVSLTASFGVLTLSGTAGLTFNVGSGTADGSMTFSGSIADINAALAGLTYTPAEDVLGAALITLVTNDQGNTGIGGALSDTDSVTINISGCVGTNSSGDDDSDGICNDRDRVPLITATAFVGAAGGCTEGGITIVTGVDEDNSGTLFRDLTLAPALQDVVNPPSYVCNGVAGATGATGATGVPGTPGAPGAPGTPGVSLLFASAGFPSSPDCPAGGTFIVIARDVDGSNTLTPGDTSTSHEICNGVPSAIRTSPSSLSACPNGGVLLEYGIDENANGTFEPGEQLVGDENLCNGASAVALTTALPVGDPTCPAGGVRLVVGTDTDADGTLTGGELTTARQSDLCNGRNALAVVTPLAPDADCPSGGQLLSVGSDDNGNGLLDLPGERDASAKICNGLNSVTRITNLGRGESGCPEGGALFESGIDADADGVLDVPSERQFQQVLCAGTFSAVRLTPLVPSPGVCPTGGVEVASGLDRNGNGALDASEVALTEEVCNGLNSLALVTTVGAGDVQCGAGGISLTVGVDANADGALTGAEIASTEKICNGRSSLTLVTPIPVGSAPPCGNGGSLIRVGLDDNGDGNLDLLSEVDSSATVCNGVSTLTTTTALPRDPTPGQCAEGGVLIRIGSDDNGNLTLDADEVEDSQIVCSGIQSALRITVLARDPAVCPTGGFRVESGRDIDGNRALDDAEVTAGENVCHGLNGLVLASPILRGDVRCPAGGTELRVGLDTNNDGDLMGAEISSTRDLCNGISMVSATTRLSPDPFVCPAGGKQIALGRDVNGNGVLDAPDEADQAITLCHGQATLTKSTQLPRDPGQCSEGGVRIDLGLDRNGNLLLEDEEIDEGQVLCAGKISIARLTELAPDPAVCATGGVRVETGVDLDGNALLSDTEVLAGQNVCQGLNSLAVTSPIGRGDPTCPAGGVTFMVGLDADNDRRLTGGEIAQMQTICNGLSSLMNVTTIEPHPDVCPRGGRRIAVGTDDNGNGTLDEAEVDAVAEICNGINALSKGTVLGRDPALCPEGGVRVDVGLDLDGDGALTPNEIDSNHLLCSGLKSMLRAVQLAPGEGGCTAGGMRVQAGLDSNGDGSLDENEATSQQVACSGVNSLLLTSAIPAGDPSCDAGGVRLTAASDLNNNGQLDDDEPRSVQNFCQIPGSLINTRNLPAGSTCSAGGVQIDVGVDFNGNRQLDAFEVQSQRTVCNGANASVSVQALPANPQVCARGGVAVLSGNDTNSNGVLDPAEITQQQNICTGIASSSRTVPLSADPNVCPNGGSRVENGLDRNGNMQLDDAEVESSVVLCSGLGLAVRTQRLPRGSSACPGGGQSVQTGIDQNGDGELQDDEVAGTQSLCESLPILFETSEVPEGQGDCVYGGVRVAIGSDDGGQGAVAGDGVLQEAERDSTRDICYATRNNRPDSDDDESCSALGGRSGSTLWLTLAMLLWRRRRQRSVAA